MCDARALAIVRGLDDALGVYESDKDKPPVDAFMEAVEDRIASRTDALDHLLPLHGDRGKPRDQLEVSSDPRVRSLLPSLLRL